MGMGPPRLAFVVAASALQIAGCDKKDPDEATSGCAETTALSEVKHEQAGSVVGTLDASKFKYASAKVDPKKENELRIFIATQDWPAEKLGTVPNPVSEDGDALVVLSIVPEDGGKGGSRVGVGSYTATKGLDSRINAEVWTKDMVTSLFLGEGSIITVASMPDGEVCGTVDVMGIFGGDKTRIKGSFAAASGE